VLKIIIISHTNPEQQQNRKARKLYHLRLCFKFFYLFFYFQRLLGFLRVARAQLAFKFLYLKSPFLCDMERDDDESVSRRDDKNIIFSTTHLSPLLDESNENE
jgi:hypothetical protein